MYVEPVKPIASTEPVTAVQPKIGSSIGVQQRASAAFLQAQRTTSLPLASQLRNKAAAAANRDGDTYEPSMLTSGQDNAHDILASRRGLRWLINFIETRSTEAIEQAEQAQRERSQQIREELVDAREGQVQREEQELQRQVAQEQREAQRIALAQSQPGIEMEKVAPAAVQSAQQPQGQTQKTSNAGEQQAPQQGEQALGSEQAQSAAQSQPSSAGMPGAVKMRFEQARGAYETFTKSAEQPYKPVSQTQQMAAHMVRSAEEAA